MIVGLDIGSKLIKAALLAGGKRRPRLVKVVVREVPEGGREALPAAIEDLFREERLPCDNVCTSVRTQDTILREITVPFSQEDAIRRTIKFEAENAFHGAAIENMVIDFYRISTVAERSRLLVVGVQKKALSGILDTLSSAGIDPPRVGLDLGALFNTAAWKGVLPEAGASIILDVGVSTVRLVIAEGGKMKVARTIRLQPTPALPAPPEPPALPGAVFAEEEEKEEAPEEEVPKDLDERAVARVVAEVSRTIVGAHLHLPIAGIWATGGGPGKAAIVRSLGEKLSVESNDLDLGKKVRSEGPSSSELGATAIGMALAGLGRDEAGIDFRKEEFRYQRAFERARWGIGTAVSVLFLMLFLVTWTFQERTRRNEIRIEIVRKTQQDLIGILFPEDLTGPDSWSIIQKQKNKLERRFKSGKDTEVRSTVRDFRTVSESLNESRADLEFTKMRLRQGGSIFEGEARTSDEVYRFRDTLLEKGKGMRITSPKIENVSEEKVKFTINIEHVE